MTETGRIREIKGKLIIVVPEKGPACFGCMNMECKTGGGFITAENPGGLSLQEGQTVEVRAPGISLLGQALAAILPPVIGFSASFFLARRLFPEAGDGVFAGTGIFFLFAAAFLVYKIRQKFPVKNAYTVTRIVG